MSTPARFRNDVASRHYDFRALDGRPPGVRARVQASPVELDTATPPTVTVVIPCFNYARFLRSAVDSALTQTGVDVDVVIVDDKSTDESLQVAQALAAEYPAVTVLAHEINQGPVA